MFPYFSAPGLVVCIGDVLPAPRVVLAILRDEAVATLSKALLVSVDEIIALMGHSFGGRGQSCRTPMLMAIPFSFRTEKGYVPKSQSPHARTYQTLVSYGTIL